MADSLDEEVKRRLATLGNTVDPEDTMADPMRSIRPSGKSTGGAEAALERLVGPGHGKRIDDELAMDRTLGEGGMGIVRLATQVSLGRKVAVKTLRPEHKNPQAALRLLTEAWVTGTIEHPNVVPIYDIGVDAQDTPVIVLKRIEGVSWDELMGDAAEVQRRFRAPDLLEWNLRVLMTVCTAIHFAHSRGIIHRDLKPENVMLGEFGEVYVLDWGIAVSTKDDGSGRLPLAKDAVDLVGTPSYLAPEMLGAIRGAAPALSPRTDVYLLGGTLHEILAGEPPHDGTTLAEIARSVLASKPRLPADCPAELSRICTRALDPDPDARFETAEQLRLAIQGYLGRRGAAKLVDEAEERRLALETELARDTAADPQRRQRLYNLLSEARFGYRTALEAWPANETAQSGLRRAITLMIDDELRNGDPRAAATLLSDLDPAPLELAARVSDAVKVHEREQQRIAAFAADHDPRIGARTRAFTSGLLGLMWVITPLLAWFRRIHWESHRSIAVVPMAYFVLIVGLLIWARESMMKTAINRRIGAAVVFMPLAMLLTQFVCWRLGIPPVMTYIFHFCIWFVLGAMLAITVEWRLFPMVLGYLAGTIAVSYRHDLRFPIMSACNAVLLVNAVVIWFPQRLPIPRKQT